MKTLAVVVLSLFASAPLAFAQSYAKVSAVDNVVMEVSPADHCAARFRFTNHNPYAVVIDFKSVGYANEGKAMPYTYKGSLHLAPGQSRSVLETAPRPTLSRLIRVNGQMKVRPGTAMTLAAESEPGDSAVFGK